jgi:hypothetical protein
MCSSYKVLKNYQSGHRIWTTQTNKTKMRMGVVDSVATDEEGNGKGSGKGKGKAK